MQRPRPFWTAQGRRGSRRETQRRKHRQRRRASIEQLEKRVLLASDFTNPFLNLDVSGDKTVSALDALQVINDLGRNGVRQLGDATGPVERFVDTNGDGRASALDALVIINALGADSSPPVINVSLQNDTAPGGTNEDLLTFDARLGGTLVDRIGVRELKVSIDGGAPVDATFSNTDGTFTFDPGLATDGSEDGLHTASLVATDARDQRSDPVELTFTLDTIALAATLNLNPVFDSGIAGDRLTTVTRVTLDGQAEPNATIRVDALGVNVQADDAGVFSISSVALSDGINAFRVQATDIAGNVGDVTERIVRVNSEDAFAIVEGNPFVVETRVGVELGAVGDERQLRVNLNSLFDLADQNALVNDVFNLFVVDANDPGQTLLDDGMPGTPVFSLTEAGARFAPGIASQQADNLLIDVSSIAADDAQLLFQLLSGDADRDGLIIVDGVQSESLANVQSPQGQGISQPPVLPGEPIDLAGFTLTNLIEVQVDRPRFDSVTGEFTATLTLINRGPAAGRDLAIALRNLPAGVTVTNTAASDGDDPVLNLRPATRRGGLKTGQATAAIKLTINNPANTRFVLDVDVLAGLPNRAPQLDAIATIDVLPGDVVRQQIVATDDDGDPLAFTIIPIPGQSSLPTMRLGADGLLEIRPEPDQVGSVQFTVQVSDGAEAVTQTVQIDVNADPVGTTRISGRVLDTTSASVSGITVNIGPATVQTDAEGRFTLEAPAGGFASDTLEVHGEEFPGPAVFPFIAEKLPLLFESGRDLFDSVNNVIDRPIFLPSLDVAGGTTIDPNVEATVQQEIAPGETATVVVAAGTLKDKQGGDFTGTLSITEVPRDLTPAALPAGVFPGTVVTIQPGEMVFSQPAPLTLPNRGGFPVGTEMELFSINPVTGEFDSVGIGRVSGNGATIETISGGIRNSSWHFFTPATSAAANSARKATENSKNQQELCDDCEKLAKKSNGKSVATSNVELHSGVLRESHAMTSYKSLGRNRNTTLSYNSGRADLRPIVHFDIGNANGDFLVATANVRRGNTTEQVPGAAAGGFGLLGGEHFWSVPNGTNDISAALQIDLSDHPSGIYDVDLSYGVRQFTNDTFVGTAFESPLPVALINSVDSIFGAGWDLAGWQQIVEEPDGRAILVDGDGTQLQFLPPDVAGTPFDPPPGDFTIVEKLADGTFRRTTTDQTVYQFNANNDLESVTDRNGNRTTYTFDAQQRLTGYVDPAGLLTTLAYTGDHVSAITDPAGRVTRLSHDAAGNLIQIEDPDGTSRQFEYDDLHHMTAETNKRGFREEAVYGFHGRVLEAHRKDGSTSLFQPAQIEGLFSTEQTKSHLTAPALASADETAPAGFVDPNGNVTQVELDQAGQTKDQSDAEGSQGRVIRNQDNLPVATFDGRGNGTFFEYDDRGNVTRIRESLLNKGNELLTGQRIAAGGSVSFVRLADLDRDGDLDAVASISVAFFNTSVVNASRVAIFENLGDGTLEFFSTVGTGGQGPQQLNLEDRNGDGTPDISVVNSTSQAANSHNFTIRLGNGDLTFGDRNTFDIPDRPLGFDFGDLNGDGLEDLIVARERNGNAAVMLADGLGGFTFTETPVGPIGLNASLADFDGDGNLDYAIGTTTGVRVAFGDGTGAFQNQQTITGTATRYSAVETADLNNDGLVDILATSLATLHVLINRGGGQFVETAFATGAGIVRHEDLAVVDLNRDGFLDVTIPTKSDGNVLAFYNEGFGQFSTSSRGVFFAGNNTLSVAIGDLNGDGDLEAVVGNELQRSGSINGAITVLEGIGDGTFNQSRENALPGARPQTVELADVNQDGILDLISIVTRPGTALQSSLALQFGDGTGDFEDAVDIPLNANGPNDFVVADFNNDGLPDFAVTARFEDDVLLVLQNPDGSFSEPQRIDFSGQAQSIEAADINNDGNVDLVARFGDIFVLLGDGTGAFPDITSFDEPFSGQGGDDELQIVDVDNDGNLDLLGTTRRNFIFMTGDDNGGFNAAVERGTGGFFGADSVAAADLNGDGLADLVAVGKGLSVRLGTGGGAFDNAVITTFGNDVVGRGIELVDFDNDGDLDALTLISAGNSVLVMLNDGNGQFVEHGRFATGNRPVNLATGDLDFDGDLDIAVANDRAGNVSLHLNQLLHPCSDGFCDLILEIDPTFSQVTRTVDRLGRQTLFDIDPTNGNLLSQRIVFGQPDPASGETDDLVTTFTYTAQGLLESETDALGRVTRYDYDAKGLVQSTTFAVGTTDEATIRNEYDAAGNRIAVIDEAGERTEFEYDALNRITRIRDAIGNVSTLTYDTVGNQLTETDALNRVATFEYDEMNRLTGRENAIGGRSQFSYDNFGNLVRQIDRLGRETEFVYDSRDRLIETIDDEGGLRKTFYDAADNIVRVTDENGNSTHLVYDADNRNTAIIDALLGTTVLTFDAEGFTTATTDQLGRRRDNFRDEADRGIENRHPDPDGDGPAPRPVSLFEYDAVGNILRETDSLGNVTQFEYDNRDRLIRVTATDPDGAGPLVSPVSSFEYDVRSSITKEIDPLGRETTREYDVLRRQTRVQFPDPDGAGPDAAPVLTSVYDAVGNILLRTDPLGNITSFEYDALNRIVRTTLPDPDGAGSLQSPVISSAYDAAGQLISRTDAIDRTTRFEYDGLGRTVRVISPDPDGAGPDTSPISQFEYDSASNQTAVIGPLGNRTTLEYDALNRVVRTVHPDPDGTGPKDSPTDIQVFDAASQLVALIDPLGRQTDFEYDALGRTVAIAAPDPDGDGPELRPVSRFEIDGLGNITATIDPLGNRTQTVYDGLNRAVQVPQPDPDGAGPQLSPVTTLVYDVAGQVTRTIDPLGREIAFAYDNLGRIVQSTEPDPDGAGPLASPTIQVTYDLVGNETSTTDALGNTTVFEFDNLYRQTAIIESDPDGAGSQTSPITRFSYDAAYQLLSVADPLGRVSRSVYDNLGRLIEQISPDPDGAGPLDSPVSTFVYDAAGNNLSFTDALGNTTQFEYDNLFRAIRTISADPDGAGPLASPVSEVDFDIASQVVATTDPLGRTTTFTYDNLGRNILRVQPDPDGNGPQQSPSETVVYDLVGNVLSTSDALGNTKTFEYDNLYRGVTETDANGDATRREFDLIGKQTALADSLGNRTTWQYDNLDRLIVKTDPLGSTTQLVYDAEDNLVETTDRLGRVVQRDYDNLYREVEQRWVDGGNVVRTIQNEFDNADQLLAVTDPAASYTYQYDDLGRRTATTASVTGFLQDVSFQYSFDAVGNTLQQTTKIGAVDDFFNNYGYDNLYRRTQIEQSSNGGNAVAEKRIDVTYDIASQIASLDRFEDLAGTQLVATTTYAFDDASRLSQLTHAKDALTIADYNWTYDAGNRTTVFQSSQDGTATYSFDARNQLTATVYDFQDDLAFNYDENGNRIGDGNVVGDNNRTLSDGTFNYEYDAEGNRTKRTSITTGEVTEYEWDHRNRLTRVTARPAAVAAASSIVTHAYDTLNRWVSTSVDADGDGSNPASDRFYFYEQNNIILDFAGANADDLSHRYLWGVGSDQILADEVIATVNQAGDILWTLGDNQNTVRDIVAYDTASDTTTVVNHKAYDSFGNVTSETNPAIDTLFSYTGRPFDDATGLQNNLNRWYDATVGKWLSEDPISFSAGDANLYRYVGNSPTQFTDPGGLEDLDLSFFSDASSSPSSTNNIANAVDDGFAEARQLFRDVIRDSFNGDFDPGDIKVSASKLPKVPAAADVLDRIHNTIDKNESKALFNALDSIGVELAKNPDDSALAIGRAVANDAGVDLASKGDDFFRILGEHPLRSIEVVEQQLANAADEAFSQSTLGKLSRFANRTLQDADQLATRAVDAAADLANSAKNLAGKGLSLAGKGLSAVGSFFANHSRLIAVGGAVIDYATILSESLSVLYIAQRRFNDADALAAHNARVAGRLREINNARVRAQNAEVRARNQQIRDARREANGRERDLEAQQDNVIIDAARREQLFLEEQRLRSRGRGGLDPLLLQLALDRHNAARRNRPRGAQSTSASSGLKQFFELAGQSQPTVPTVTTTDGTKNDCPPENE